MKNKLVKKIAVLMMAAVMSMSVMACGSAAEEANVDEAAVEEAVEEEAATEEAEVVEEAATEEAEVEEAATEEAEVVEETATEEAEAVEEEAATGEALTEEEYIAAVQAFGVTLTDTMAQAQEELTAMSEGDVDAAIECIEGLKAPFVEFAATVAPEKYTAAQEKYASGCNAMIEYLDVCIEAAKAGGDADATELQEKLVELITTIQNDFTEANTLMTEAAAE